MNIRLISLLLTAALLPSLAVGDSSLNGAKNGRKPSVTGSILPDMKGRRPELIPMPLPRRVLYVFAPNTVVNDVADKLAVALQNGDATIIDKTLCLQPGG